MMKILKETQSLCPICRAVISAHYVSRNGAVFFEKHCVAHGHFSVLASDDELNFLRWSSPTACAPPKRALTDVKKGCPFDCGTCANHQQAACCVVLEVTQRCNMHCHFCYASSSPATTGPEPSIKQIGEQYDFLLSMGESRPFNLQLSGGEPTLRSDLPQIIALAREKGFPYIQLNTNGLRLAEECGYAQTLKDAGLSSVFLQFDSLQDEINQKIRAQPLTQEKLRAIHNCRKAGLPVALVPVVIKGINEGGLGEIIRFAAANTEVIKGVHFQPLAHFGRYPDSVQNRITLFELMSLLKAQTNGRISSDRLGPTQTGHGLCSFSATYVADKDGTLNPTVKRNTERICCCSGETLMAQNRDFVKEMWQAPKTQQADKYQDELDRFIETFRRNSLTITAMQFQDIWSLDLERVARCRVHVLTADCRLIPFCMYNLTDANGEYLYRVPATPS